MVWQEQGRVDHIRRQIVGGGPLPACSELLQRKPAYQGKTNQGPPNGLSLPKRPVAGDLGRIVSKRGSLGCWKHDSPEYNCPAPISAGRERARVVQRDAVTVVTIASDAKWLATASGIAAFIWKLTDGVNR